MKKNGAGFSGILIRSLLFAPLLVPSTALGACVCTSGKMMNWFPGSAPISIDGDMLDWSTIINSPTNNICDGSPGAAISDVDAPIQSTGRDLMQFTYTFDSNYVYAYTQRYASSTNTDNFIYYADTNNNGVMDMGEPVVVVSWQGSNRTIGVSVGTYQPYYPAGDPMVCTPGYTAGQNCTPGFADGYHLPGSIVNLPSNGHPDYSGQWGSNTGTEMEWRVSWADLGLAGSPGTPFTFHVASTNSQPGAGSFPAQVDDNMGGCGGKGGTTQYGGATLTPAQTISLTTATSYTTSHTLTNTGNGSDNFTLSSTITGSNNPIPTVTYYYNGQTFTDTSGLGASFSLASGQSITVTTVYSFSASPASKSYNVTTTSKSDFDPTVSGQVVDTLTSQEAVVISNKTVGGYGSFGYSGGSNGLPSNLTLTSTSGNNPVESQGYVVNSSQAASITEAITGGWIFGSGACSYASGTAVNPANYSFTNNGGSVVLNIAKAAFTGDNVICTFTNQKLPTITVKKVLGAARVSDSDQFTVQLSSGGTVVASSATTGTGEQVASGSGTFSYTPAATGASYALGELKSAGTTPAGVYAPSVSCLNNGVALSSPSALGEGFTPGIGDNYVCWITNTPPQLRVQAQSFAGTGVFAFSGTNGIASNFSLDTSTGNPAGQGFVLSSINTPTSVTQTSMPSGWGLSGASCVDGTSNTVPNTTLASGTLTVPAAAIVAGANLVCTFADIYEPRFLVTKTADKTNVAPGQVVTYSSQLANSAGYATNVILTDTLSPYTAFAVDGFGPGLPFQFADGSTPSGLTLGAPLFSRDNGVSWSYIPASGGGGAPAGFDGNVTNWKIPMNGKMNGWSGSPSPYPSFTVNYKVLTR